MNRMLSSLAIPAMIFFIVVCGLAKKNVAVYDCFVEGAKEGLSTTIKILPALVGLLVAVSMLRASGALDLITYAISPLASLLHLPKEILPLALMRPISGSASLAIVSDILKNFGPDSFIGRSASIMMGSTETTFYTLAVYFGSVGIKKSRHTVATALMADLTGILVSVWICRIFFGN